MKEIFFCIEIYLFMSLLQEYGARPPIEFLREFLGTHGWYDRKERIHYREGEEEGLREDKDNSILLLGAMTLQKGSSRIGR